MSVQIEHLRHIVLFLPFLRGGGAERVMVTLANGFAAKGHRVDLVIADADGPYLKDVADTIRIVDFKKKRVLTSLLPLVSFLKKNRPDALLSAMGHANLVAIIARVLSRAKFRLVISEHNSPAKDMQPSFKGRILRLITPFFYKFADSIVCVSKGVETEVIDVFKTSPQKTTTIYNPFEIDEIRKKSLKSVSHDWLGGAAPLVLAVGRLVVHKDYPTLLKAFAIVRAERPAKLIILGEGPEAQRLTALADELKITEDVQFLGFQENPFAWMRAADLYVMSSASEGFGNVLVEAMICGSKVVSTDCPNGPSEILEGGRWGHLVSVGDENELSQAILLAFTEDRNSEVILRAQCFGSDVITRDYLQVLFGNRCRE